LSTISVDVSVRLAISQAAFEAIARTLPRGNVSFENATNEHGQHYVRLDRAVVDRLGAMRRPGESYSRVVLRLAAEGGGWPTFNPCNASLIAVALPKRRYHAR
jgi:hypothetical protein